MSLSTLAACCAVGLLSHPFNSFTILSWNQPASFVATFARRKIESVLDFFQKELPQNDSYNTRDYYWFHASMRAVGFGMVYRGILMWSCTGAMSLSPVIPSWVTSCFRFVKSKLLSSSSSSSSSTQNRIDEDESTSSMTKTSNNDNRKRIQYAPDRILGYTVSYSTGIIVRSTFRSLTSGLATFLATPLQIVLIIFVADISGGYPDLKRAWMGLRASCFCDWERDHPHYQPGDNPWQLKKRPHWVKMMWNKLSKLEVLERAVLPFVKYAMLHSIVSSAIQYSEAWFQMKSRSHRYDRQDSNNSSDESKKDEQEDKEDKEECHEEDHSNDIVSIIQSKKLTPVQKIKKIFSICSHASRIFVVASVAHGLVSYNMSQVLSTAVQNFCRMTDYAQPYQAAGGLSSIADPMVMRVPKISLFFGISDGIFWGMITTLVTMWR